MSAARDRHRSVEALLLVAIGAALAAGCSGQAAAPATVSLTRTATVTLITELPPVTVTETETSARTVTEEVPTTVTETPTSTSLSNQSDAVQVGQVAKSGGITMTVTSIKKIGTYPTEYNDDHSDVGPKNGGQLVQVTSKVTNHTKASIDLTCGFPIDARLVDDDSANYDPVEDLYKIRGNPGCNDNLQPGFGHSMIWVYEIPKSSKANTFGFKEVDLSSSEDFPYALVAVPASVR